MAIFKCKMCGADLEINENQTTCKCSFCGSSQTISFANNSKKISLFNRANSMRMKKEFDKASAIYNSILVDYPEDPEAHWGLVLCRYGVEYVTDPLTEQKIPTCNRTQYKSIFDDNDYISAIKYADVVAQRIYEEEARKINNIQKHILEISQREDPFDIFICYKETNSTGGRTKDSVIAQDIYDKLVEKGYKVFFARVTLETKIGLYEPYIFAALNSAKIMIVIGTKKDHFESVWVKNEWTRFLDLMSPSKEKYLIPCYLNMDAYQLPEELLDFQAQDLNKLGYLQDLVRGIDKLIGDKKVKDIIVESKQMIVHSNVNVDSLLTRIEMTLEDEDYEKCEELIEKVLDNDPKNAKVYFYKLMKELYVPNIEVLIEKNEILDEYVDFQKALKFADSEYKVVLNAINEKIKFNIKYKELDIEYQRACNLMNVEQYDSAIDIFSKLGRHRDSVELLKQCKIIKEKNELAKLQRIYEDAMKDKSQKYYSNAITKFSTIIDYKDSKNQIEECRNLIYLLQKEDRYTRALKIFHDYNKLNIHKKDDLLLAKALLLQNKDYKDSLDIVKKIDRYLIDIDNEIIRIKSRNKKVAIMFSILTTFAVSIYLLITLLFIPQYEYNKAIKYLNNGNYEKAEVLLKDNKKFKDAKKQLVVVDAVEYLDWGNYEKAIDEIYSIGGTVNISYDGDGGIPDKEIEIIKPLSYVDSEATKSGYEFYKWKLVEYDVNAKKYTIDIVLKATYKAQNYSITYDLNGGISSVGLPTKFNYEKRVTIPSLTKENHVFKGWLVDNSTEPVLNLVIEPKTIAKNIKLTAYFEGADHQIILDTDGGEVSNLKINVKYGEYVTNLPIPTKVGYQFDGWYYMSTKIDEKYKYNFSYNISVKAKWKLKEYSIVYAGNVGNVSLTGRGLKFEYTINDEIILPDLQKEGYTFTGWTIEKLGITIPTKGLKIPVITKETPDMIIIGYNFVPNNYSITYNVNGGIENYGTIEYTYNQELDLPTPTRIGYEFIGWYKEGALFNSNVMNVDENFTLMAKWEIIDYELVYQSNINFDFDNWKTTHNVNSSSNIDDPELEGYTFVGWTIKELGIDVPTKNLILPKIDFNTPKKITLYANFSANNYSITYDVNGGKENFGTIEYTYGQELELPTPTRDGYGFDGWYKDGVLYESTTFEVAENFTLIAEWKAGQSRYIVNHYVENLTGGYSLKNGSSTFATTDTYIMPSTNYYEGFTAPIRQSVKVTADGKAKVDYFYTRNSYTLTFISNGGNEVEAISLKYEETLSSDVVTVKEGFTFGGWYEDVGLTTQFIKQKAMNATLYAYWTEETITNKFTYTVNETNSSINSYIGEDVNVVIPQYIGGKKVEILINGSFKESEINSIILPQYLTTISSQAFMSSTIKSITFNNLISNIGSECFKNSQLAGKLDLSNLFNLDAIQTQTFYNTRLNNVILPESVITIGSYAFSNSTLLNNVQMPGVTRIHDNAFYNCSSLYNVTYSSDLSMISSQAFYNTNIYRLVISSNATLNSGSLSGMRNLMYLELNELTSSLPLLFGYSPYSNSYKVGNFYLPNSLNSIKINGGTISQKAFEDCYSITTIELNNVTSIGELAFKGLSNLSTLKLYAMDKNLGQYFGTEKFENSEMTRQWLSGGESFDYYVPISLKYISIYSGEIPYMALRNCINIKSVNLGEEVTKIKDNAFGDTTITSIVIPEKVTSIGAYAFHGCKKLVSVEFSNVSTIGEAAFYNCSSIESLTLTFTSIGRIAFSNLTSLKEVYMNETVTSSYDNVFGGSGIDEGFTLYISDDVTKITSNLFKSSRINEIKINETSKLESIENYAFANIQTLTEINILNQVETIGEYAFSGCENIETMNYGAENLNGKFNGVKINTLNIKNTVISIPDNFMHKSTVSNMIFEDDSSLTTIGSYAFDSVGLTNIIIPETVTKVESYAFANNNNVSMVDYYAKKIENNDWGSNVFDNLGSITTNTVVNIHDTVLSIPNYLFYSSSSSYAKIYELNIGKNVASIGTSAFNGALDYLVYLNYNAISSTISYNAFSLTTTTNNKNVILTIGTSVNVIPDYFNTNSSIDLNIVKMYIEKDSSLNRIGKNAFDKAFKIYVEAISDYATISYSTSVNESLFSIGCTLYLNNELVEDLYLDESVTEVGYRAFYKSNIKTLNISKEGDALIIKDYAFAESILLIDVYISSRVSNIGNYAFYQTGLETLLFAEEGENLSLGARSFSAARELNQTSLIIPGRIKYIGNYAFVSTSNEPKVKTLILKDGIEEIGAYAFAGSYYKIIELIVPNSVKKIGIGAFKGMDSLETISLPFVGESVNATNEKMVFGYIFDCSDYRIHEGQIYQYTHYHGEYPDYEDTWYYNIPNSIRNIFVTNSNIVPDYSFNNMSFVEKISFDLSIISIGNYAFSKCNNLSDLKLIDFNSIISVGDYAFAECGKLNDFELTEHINHIGKYAFDRMNSNIELTIPSNMITIPTYSFARFYGKINLHNNIEVIEERAFFATRSFVNLDLTQFNIKKIGSNAFESSSIETIIFPDSPEVIFGSNIFAHCTKIKRVVIPEEASSIPVNPFEGVSYIEEVIYNSTKYTGDNSMFTILIGYNNTIEKVYIGSGVTNLSFLGTATVNFIVFNNEIVSRPYHGIYYNNAIVSKNVEYIEFIGSNVFFEGSYDDFQNIIDENTRYDVQTKIYYYDENLISTDEINYWHYDDNGSIVIN